MPHRKRHNQSSLQDRRLSTVDCHLRRNFVVHRQTKVHRGYRFGIRSKRYKGSTLDCCYLYFGLGNNYFTVVGYNNSYSLDFSGESPLINIDGGVDALTDSPAGRMHVTNREGYDIEDTIDEVRADFTWLPDSGNAFSKMEFGAYYQDRS